MQRMLLRLRHCAGMDFGRKTNATWFSKVSGTRLGLKPEMWRVLDKCHNVRNLAEYEGHFNADEQLLKDLLRVTEIVGRSVEKLGPVSAKRK